MSHLRTSWGGRRWAVALLLALAGCGGNSQEVDPPLPSLSELARATRGIDSSSVDSQPDGASSVAPSDAQAMGVVAISSIARIWLPGYQSLDAFWAEASTATLSESDLNLWRENQLRAAVVNKVDLPALLQKLPGHLGVRQQMLTLTSDLTPLEPASLQEALLPVTVVVYQEKRAMGRGKAQLLIAADPQQGEAVKVTILPHIYHARVSLLPRPHTEAALDGQIVTDLKLRALLRPGQVLIIGADVPLPAQDDTPTPPKDAPPASPSPQASSPEGPSPEASGSEPQPVVLEVPPATRDEPAKLHGVGRAVLTGRRLGTPLQQIILLEMKKAS